jgi:hypothetical protein
MKHLGKVSAVRGSWVALKARSNSHPDMADAKADYLNAIWKATTDFAVAKKNEVSL